MRAINSLLLSIELFNRPYEYGRTEAVLIALDHSFEMLMKAIIYEKTGKTRARRSKYSYAFKKCVNIMKDTLHIIIEDQAMTLNTINDLRDAAMHHVISLSEESLYLHSQSGVTLFDDLLRGEFNKPLRDYLPERVLPISTNPPADIQVFFDEEFSQIQDLIAPGRRQRARAIAKLRPLIILERNITGKEIPIVDYEVNKFIKGLREGGSWEGSFPGIATLRIDSTGTGLTYCLRLTKKEGLPVRPLRQEEDPCKAMVYREVNLLDRYSLRVTRLAGKLGITVPKANALIEYLDIQKNEEFFKEFAIDKQRYKSYSPELIPHLKQKLKEVDMDEVWETYRKKHYRKR